MDKQELQKLRDLPIEGVAERLGLQVSKHKCLCPFHPDKHPSLSFSVRRNRYRCFVCEASGGTIDLVMHLLNKDRCEQRLGSRRCLPRPGCFVSVGSHAWLPSLHLRPHPLRPLLRAPFPERASKAVPLRGAQARRARHPLVPTHLMAGQEWHRLAADTLLRSGRQADRRPEP